MKKLLRDCAVVALVVWGIYTWTHPPVLRREPVIPGAMPNLAMPAVRPFSAEAGSSMLVVREESSDGQPHLDGRPRRERALGTKPHLLGESAVDVTAGRVPDALPDERSPWSDRLRQPWAVGAVVALFIVLYAVLTRALWRGSGEHGFTHD
jgi:hypothetical protein